MRHSLNLNSEEERVLRRKRALMFHLGSFGMLVTVITTLWAIFFGQSHGLDTTDKINLIFGTSGTCGFLWAFFAAMYYNTKEVIHNARAFIGTMLLSILCVGVIVFFQAYPPVGS